MGKVITAGVIGGVIVFFWGFISHMALPFHNQAHKAFPNEAEVMAAIRKGVEQGEAAGGDAGSAGSGMYLMPYADVSKLTPEEHEAFMKKWSDDFMMFSSVRVGGTGSMGKSLGYHAAMCIVGGILLAWILRQCSNNSFIARMQFIKSVALFAIFAAIIPNWTWWGFSDFYSLLYAADLLIAWSLAGAVMCKIIGPGPNAASAS